MAAMAGGYGTRSPLYLHKFQSEVCFTESRFKVVVAGRRWGKTQLAKAELIRAAKKPRMLVWYVAPSYRMAKDILWLDLVESIPRSWIKKVNETIMQISLVNGSRIVLKGADNPDSLRGVGLDFVVLDEFQDQREFVWSKVLRPTLSTTQGKALFIGTPKHYNHLYKLWCLGQDEKNRRMRRWHSWQFPTITSPFVPKEEIEQAMHDMDEKSFRQEYMASFESMSGRVYYPFDRKIHVGDFKFNPHRKIWIGQDFNFDPMSSIILQPQENGEVWAVAEQVLFNSNTEEAVSALEQKYWRYLKGLQVTVYPDPAGGQRQHARGETDLDIFREKGFRQIKFRKKSPMVSDRVNAVNRMLKAADGTVRLRVDRSCEHLIDSLEQVQYKEKTREVDKSMNIEHITDALGYCLDMEYSVRKVRIIGAHYSGLKI